jgi:hypothetical protein
VNFHIRLVTIVKIAKFGDFTQIFRKTAR